MANVNLSYFLNNEFLIFWVLSLAPYDTGTQHVHLNSVTSKTFSAIWIHQKFDPLKTCLLHKLNLRFWLNDNKHYLGVGPDLKTMIYKYLN